MDGRNGIFRWEYATQGKSNGYGAFELTGIIHMGWWAFLDTDRVRKIYRLQAGRFPLSRGEIELYVGPNTSRKRHRLVMDPEAYRNGFNELIVKLAARLQLQKERPSK